jgi:hypothetical protein
MGLSGYDAQQLAVDVPPRTLWVRAVRYACTNGLRRGLIPPSGAPKQAVVSALMRDALRAVATR